MEKLKIADKTFSSRLFTGTGKFRSNAEMGKALIASGSELVTMALKRVDVTDENDDILKHLSEDQFRLVAQYLRSENSKRSRVRGAVGARGTGNELD